jgi:SPP1 gp7 family putative phage head morphogenesis protein
MTKAEQAEQAKKNQRAHQAAEAAALALLLHATNEATDRSTSAATVASAMRPKLRDAIVLGRQGARERGVSRLVSEANLLNVRIDTSALGSEFARDWTRGSLVSRSHVDRWLKKAHELEDVKAATAATRGSIERIAATESSEAFSAGRTRAAKTVTESELMRVWDASLDKRTCDVCSGADGKVVGVNEPFPAGEPGAVHAFCRCGWTLTKVSFLTKAH